MPRTLSTNAAANVDSEITRPIYVVELAHSGISELLSASGEVVYDGRVFTAGGCTVTEIQDALSASLELPWSPARVGEIQTGAWRGGICKVWAIPGLPESENQVYAEEDGVLMVDGKIRSSSFSGNRIRVSAEQVSSLSRMSPRYTYESVCNHIPPAGTQIVWDGMTITLQTRDSARTQPAAVSTRAIRGRPSAREIKALATPAKDTNVTVTAANTPIPILYGNAPRAGEIIAVGTLSGDLVIAVGWGYGEMRAIDKVYINDAPLPISGVTVTHYLGTTTQTADATLASAIAAYADDLVLSTPDGDIGIGYSVFRIDPGTISGDLRFSAVIRGRKVYDPRITVGDPYPSARYWRIYVTDTETADTYFTSIAEIQMRATLGGSDQCSGGTASASSVDGSNTAAKAFDNNSSTVWLSEAAETGPQWIRYDFGSATTVAQVVIQAQILSSGAARAPVDFLIQYSDDGTSWTTAHDVRSSVDWTSNETRTFDIPEASDVVYTENSALCTADLATNPVFGMGVAVSGVSDCADWNDSLLGGALPRCRLALTLTQPQPTASYLDLMAGAYAELFWYWEGASIVFVPDQAVDLETVLTEEECIRDTLTVDGIDDGDTPNRVYVRHTQPSSTSGYWPEILSPPQSLPGVSAGEVSLVESTLTLPGITRPEEAANKALARLEQMKNRVRISWVTRDRGIVHRKGDVRRHLMPSRGTDIYARIMSVKMISYGRYRVTGMRYDPAHYPSELVLPDDMGTIPVGAILPLSGDTIPAGWSDFTDANGKYILIAGDSISPGDTGGDSATIATYSVNTSTDSMHSRSAGTRFPVAGDDGAGASSTGTIQEPGTNHNHAVQIPEFTISPLRRENKLVKKTGSAATTIPPEVQVFGLPNLALAGLSRVVAASNRALFAAAANANAGESATPVGSATSGAGGVNHNHIQSTGNSSSPDFGPSTRYTSISAGGSHTHSVSLTARAAMKSKTLALWGAGEEYPIIPGFIVLWEDMDSIPTDWVACDGTGATPDLRERYPKIAPIGGEDVASGDNTITITGSVDMHSHGHATNESTASTTTNLVYHSADGRHTHTVTDTKSWAPPYYALGAIMYAPS